ncbi:MAG: homoserine kinase [Polyangiaceae bacterium]
MAVLTPLDLDAARTLGRAFGLDVEAVEGLMAGSVNSNFALTTTRGPFFLRVVEEQGPEGAAREARLLALLSSRGVRTPEPIRRVDGDGFTATHAGKPVVVFPFVEGRSLAQREVTPEATRVVGAALAGVHAVGASLTPTALADVAGPSRFDARALVNRLDGIPDTSAPDVRATRDRLKRFFASADAAPPSHALGQGLIHGDLFRDNVLFRGSELVALLDFESASRGALAFDVMVTALSWCFGDDLDLGLVRGLFDGYASVRALPRIASEELFAQGRAACARFATTRITDFELRPRGAGVYKDFRRFVRRLDALESLGPKGLEGLLVH